MSIPLPACVSSRVWCAAFLVAFAAAAPCAAADPLEQRVEALEARLAQLARENAALKTQLGLDAKSPAAQVLAAGRENRLSLGGYIQGQAEFGDAPDSRYTAADRFFLRRARVTLRGGFAEQFGFTLQSEFGSNTSGAASGVRAQATDAFILWNRFEAAQLTMGQFKTPYGYEQLLSDTKILTIERSLPSDQLTLSRQLGAMLSGTAVRRTVAYAFGVFNSSGINTSLNDNDQFLYVGRVSATAAETKAGTFALGAGAFTTRDTGAFTGRRTGTALDAQFTTKRAGLYAEYFKTHYDRVAGADYDAAGWSLLAAYFVLPKTLQAVGRFETFDPNRSATGDDTALWTLGFNYFIKGDDLVLSLNYLLGEPPGARSHRDRLITRLQLVF